MNEQVLELGANATDGAVMMARWLLILVVSQ
jgi:hypothetical protein